MTGRTHKLSGKVIASLAFISLNFETLLVTLKSGLLQSNLTVLKITNFKTEWKTVLTALAMLLMLRTFSKVTSVLPDLDQQSQAIPYKDNLIARFVNKILLALNQHHRSHATHTISTTVVISVILAILSLSYFSKTSLVTVVTLGYACGIVSHILADMFNGTGVYPFLFSKKKVAFVPRKVNSFKLIIISLSMLLVSIITLILPQLIAWRGVGIVVILIACSLFGVAVCCRGMTFKTGGQWENIFYKVVNVLDVAATTLACMICFI